MRPRAATDTPSAPGLARPARGAPARPSPHCTLPPGAGVV